MARPRPLGNISLATRLSLVALVVTLVSLTVTATVGLVRGSDLAGEVADDQLVSVSASRATAVEVALTAIRREVAALATSPATSESISSLGDAVRELASEPVDRATADALTEYYLAEVVPELELVRNTRIGPSFLVPSAPQAIYLQGAYTVPADNAGDGTGANSGTAIEPELVLDPGDGSTYSSLHAAVHQTYGRIGTISRFDDLFLVDARDNTIVYSFRKRIDFATSLDVGPHSGSALARLLDTIADDPSGGARLSDFAPYVPAGEAPTTFVASAVLDGDGRLVGYVAGALSVAQFDAVLSGNGDWDGAGDTGDIFLAGPDGIMRTTSRRYSTQPAEFLAEATEPGPGELTEGQRRRISRTGTTALVQPIDRRIVDAAADGPGLVDSVDYRGVDVRTAYRPLAIDDVQWTIVSEIARDELDDPIERYARDMLLAMALFVVGVTFVAVRWSDRIVAPIRAIARRLRSVRTVGGATTGPVDVPADGPQEYRELADNVDDMLQRLADRQSAVDARNAERVGLLRQFLPANVARRSEESDGEVLDHVGNASVVILTLDGVADLVGGAPDQQVRDLLAEIIDEVDALATDFGIERIKLTGATYYAVCGATRPFLDHAPRAVGFGLATRDLVDDLGDGRLAVRGGVASGPVSVGLAARAALLYDVWGETVARAEQLAASAPGGTILVSEAVRTQLPAEFVTAGDPTEGSVAVTARLIDEAAR